MSEGPVSPNRIVMALGVEVTQGIPVVAPASTFTAPVHIDVGGTIYTSTLETLNTYPNSKLAKLFNGTYQIVLDTLKQHYFIDRDGGMFGHVLNYLRNRRLLIPTDFQSMELLQQEADFFEITPMVIEVKKLRGEMMYRKKQTDANLIKMAKSFGEVIQEEQEMMDVVSLYVDSDPKMFLTCEGSLLMELFPDIAFGSHRNAPMPEQIWKLPLSQYIKLDISEVLPIMLSAGFYIKSLTTHLGEMEYDLIRPKKFDID